MKSTLLKTMQKYAGTILTEDATPEAAGNFIIKLYNKKYKEDDIVKNLNNIIFKDWVSTTVLNKEKLIKITLNPMNWHGGDTESIIDSAIAGKNPEQQSIIRKILNKWVELAVKTVMSKYSGYSRIINNRKKETA